MKVLISDKIYEKALALFKANSIDFAYQPEITPPQLLKIIPNYSALIVRSRTKVTKDIINVGKNLKVIGRVGSGVDNIDLMAAKKNKVIVVNAPDANSQAVAEHTVGLILSLLRKYENAFSSMRKGLWFKKELKGSELQGKTVGIVGYGHIGRKVEKLVKAFGANVLIYSRSFKTTSLINLFKKSDIVTIHVSLNPKTKGFLNQKLLSLLKPTAFLVNTSRGEVIEEDDLYKLLKTKKITGAALDVFWQEPLTPNSKWRKLENVILTPHIGASTSEALKRASLVVVKDVLAILKGKKPHFSVS